MKTDGPRFNYRQRQADALTQLGRLDRESGKPKAATNRLENAIKLLEAHRQELQQELETKFRNEKKTLNDDEQQEKAAIEKEKGAIGKLLDDARVELKKVVKNSK